MRPSKECEAIVARDLPWHKTNCYGDFDDGVDDDDDDNDYIDGWNYV